MRRLAKNLILATAVVSVICLVDLSTAQAATEQPYRIGMNDTIYLDFWSKFRDTVMPDPDEPQDNNPPKEEPPPDESSPSEDESESET